MITKEEMALRLRELADAIEGQEGDNLVVALAVGGNGKFATLRHVGDHSTSDTSLVVIGLCSILHTMLVDDHFAFFVPRAPEDGGTVRGP